MVRGWRLIMRASNYVKSTMVDHWAVVVQVTYYRFGASQSERPGPTFNAILDGQACLDIAITIVTDSPAAV